MTEFLSEPRPERICQVSFGPKAENEKPNLVLSVGIKVITEDRMGLKVVPHKAVVFAIGELADGKSVNEVEIDMGPMMARGLAESILRFCAFIEKDGE